MPRYPLRFSLATLLFLATVVCMGIALWSSTRRLRTLQRDLADARNQMQQYRDELGHLTILDEEKLNVIRMPLRAEMQWQWRIYVPEADRFAIAVATGKVPKEGFGGMANKGLITLGAGETIVHASVFRDLRGELVFRVKGDHVTGNHVKGVGIARGSLAFKTPLKGELADLLDAGGQASTIAGSGGTEVANPGEPFALLRFRANEETQIANADGTVSTVWRAPKGSTIGVMAWITDSEPTRRRSGPAPRTEALP